METDHSEDTGADAWIILKRIFKKENGGRGMDTSGPVWGQVTGSCEHGNEPSGPIKCWEFLD